MARALLLYGIPALVLAAMLAAAGSFAPDGPGDADAADGEQRARDASHSTISRSRSDAVRSRRERAATGSGADDGVAIGRPARPRGAPMGDAPPLEQESAVAATRDTPQQLLEGVFAARARGDRAWLCRTWLGSGNQPQLTLLDTQRAYRIFLWKPVVSRWEQLEAAWLSGDVEIDAEAGRAQIRYRRLGREETEAFPNELELRADGWYFAGFEEPAGADSSGPDRSVREGGQR